MIKLGPATLRKLVFLLGSYLNTEEDRRTRVRLSVGELALLENLPWQDSNEVFITDLVSRLGAYGQVESGDEALWVFLDSIKDYGGVDFRKRIDKLWTEIVNTIEGTRYQDLQSLTVYIKNPETRKTVGVGLLVQEDYVITCGGVIREAVNENLSPEIEVGVGLNSKAAKTLVKQERLRSARVIDYVSHYGEEIVILRLDGPSLSGELHAKISSAGDSRRNLFEAYGYVGPNSPDDYVRGEILGNASYDSEDNEQDLLVDSVLLAPHEDEVVYSGMRGAGVLDLARNRVIGILVRELEGRQRRAEAVDGLIVSLEPFCSHLNNGGPSDG